MATVRAAPAIDGIDDHSDLLAGRRLGLVLNHGSLDSRLTPTLDRLRAVPRVTVVRLFAPEHGLAGARADAEPDRDGTDPDSGLPVVALYGPRRVPEPAHFDGLDAVAFDLPDAGCRAYTYLATLLGLCDTAAAAGVDVVVLDRPNPLGGAVEGGGVEPDAVDFVACYDLPLRHGLTLGEAALLYCAERGLPRPTVVRCAGWRREPVAPGAVWVAPSPNLPSAAAALAYPGTVLFEGTAVSEGRGTTRPFTLLGAPGLDGRGLARRLANRAPPGLLVRAATFRPVASKHAGATCTGVELYIADRTAYRALPVALEILAFIRDHHDGVLAPTGFMDSLAGGPALRRWCAAKQAPTRDLLDGWTGYQAAYRKRIAPHLLYPEAA
ncbi:MAG: DUF1343 domain-containing protein [Alphaproteobacteria bacterium]